MEKQINNNWDGPERRRCPEHGSCLDHTGINARLNATEKAIIDIENNDFVPFSNYKWSFGILASILISLFTIAIYLSLSTNENLNKIAVKQETANFKLTQIQNDILENADDIKDIKKRLQ